MTTEANIRDRLQHERAQIASLRATINRKTADYLFQQLHLAAGTLDIVDHCISAKVMAESRTPSALTWWLTQTSNLLKTAEAQSAYVAEIVAKYGPDVMTV